MRQQINLYQPSFSEERKLFSALTVAITLGLVLIALAGFSAHAYWGVAKLEREVALLREQHAQQESRLAQAGELQAARAQPAEIEARIKQLTAALSNRTRALEILQSGAAGQTSGFGARLEALARRHVDGLWLDVLVLSGANGSMSLSGATVDADLVPVYLHNLARETVLNGTRFDDFVIERPDAKAKDGELAAADSSENAPKKSRNDAHVRFRAGNKALMPAAPPEATS
jgi:Tfp pilus assembly protein PilN